MKTTNFRYILSDKVALRDLVIRINGNVRGTSRQAQFIRLCAVLDVTYLPPIPLTNDNAWFAGFLMQTVVSQLVLEVELLVY